MADFEVRQVGNTTIEDLYDTDGSLMGIEGDVPSMIEQWRQQGIRYELTDPVARKLIQLKN